MLHWRKVRRGARDAAVGVVVYHETYHEDCRLATKHCNGARGFPCRHGRRCQATQETHP